MIENVLWNDVVGEPMAMRLGVKISSDDEEKTNELLRIALDLKVKNFDVTFSGRGAPVYSALQQVLEERGIQHDLSKKFPTIT